MYPGMAKSARDEGFDEIADGFETLAKAEDWKAGATVTLASTLPMMSIEATLTPEQRCMLAADFVR